MLRRFVPPLAHNRACAGIGHRTRDRRNRFSYKLVRTHTTPGTKLENDLDEDKHRRAIKFWRRCVKAMLPCVGIASEFLHLKKLNFSLQSFVTNENRPLIPPS